MERDKSNENWEMMYEAKFRDRGQKGLRRITYTQRMFSKNNSKLINEKDEGFTNA